MPKKVDPKPYYAEKNKRVGMINIADGLVDITDPCYDEKVWCAVHNKKVKPGKYNCFIDIVNFPYYDNKNNLHNDYRCMRLSIVHKEEINPVQALNDTVNWETVFDDIGVDAGLCGFYNHKPSLDEEDAWTKFWTSLQRVKGYNIECDTKQANGVTVSSGFGDGSYLAREYNKDGEIIALDLSFNY